jgi:outer membrane protein
MVRCIVSLLVVVFVCSSIVSNAEARDLKVGYIDMQRVFTEYQKTKKAESKFEQQGKAKTDERNKIVESIRRMKDEIELLSEKGREEKQGEIDKNIKELQDFDRRVRDELWQEREDIVRDISKDIDGAITEFGKKAKYDMILNKDRRVLLYEAEGLDVTAEIIKILNK